MEKTFGVIVSDERQCRLAAMLRCDGADVSTYGAGNGDTDNEALERVLQSDVVILPLPLSRTEGILNCPADPMPLASLFSRLRNGQRILAGQIKPQEQKKAAQYGLLLEDYFLREELTVANAAATAEGAIRTAMERSGRMLLGQKALVLGFGRIGKLLSFRLQALGVCVSATARRLEDLAWIRAYGCKALETFGLSGHLQDFDLVFNTIPAPVLGEELLSQLPERCVCIDLASREGIDAAAAKKLGLEYVWARSLPGKMVPESAAGAIQEAVYHILSEQRGELS